MTSLSTEYSRFHQKEQVRNKLSKIQNKHRNEGLMRAAFDRHHQELMNSTEGKRKPNTSAIAALFDPHASFERDRLSLYSSGKQTAVHINDTPPMITAMINDSADEKHGQTMGTPITIKFDRIKDRSGFEGLASSN